MKPRFSSCALALFVLLTTPKIADASDNGGTAVGKVSLAAPGTRRKAPQRGQGFIPRSKSALRAPDGLDPRLDMVVVLEGGSVDELDRKARTARYDIVGENFVTNILPVIVGGKVEIKNMGRKTPRLYSQTQADVVPSDPINKKGVRLTKAIAEAHKPIDIRDQDSPHFLAHIVAFEHAYFSPVAFDGSFSIEGVPAGNWKIKIWYRDGWVTNLPETSVSVPAKKSSKPVSVKLPAKLTLSSAGK